MDILRVFGQRIKNLRIARGLSQEELAELANLHRTYISSIERGQRNVSLKNIEALAISLNISVEALFTDEQK